FPPKPPTTKLRKKIIRQFCEETNPATLTEAGCAVCGLLTRLELLESTDVLDAPCLELLSQTIPGLTRQTRLSSDEPIHELHGPILDDRCSGVCKNCINLLRRGKTPALALANGTWLGKVPTELQ
ncbi:hypothetical protein BJ138DRAFT_965385, partial [Hygrophoropsis aurantiaca]